MLVGQELALRAGTQPAVIAIPPYRKELLFISYDKPRGHGFGLQFSISISEDGGIGLNQDVPDDPSTIYSSLPAVDPKSETDVEKLPYFPTYSEMQPEQRGRYLRWLHDITRPIEIGYVFVYYYGLERHLVYGNFDAAFDEIELLRTYHHNGSFLAYSASALVHACLLRKRVDKLKELYSSKGFDYFGNSNLLILYYNNLDILPDMLFQLALRVSGTNRRYLKLQPDLYLEKISEILTKNFNRPSYPLSEQISLDGAKGIPYPIFANISFPPEIRSPNLPNLLRDENFLSKMRELFKEVHTSVKIEAARQRKNA